MKIQILETWGQVYLTPTIRITHDKMLNGNREFILGWWKWELVFTIPNKTS